MRTLRFDDYAELVNVIDDTYDEVTTHDEFNSVDIIAKYDDARLIISELIMRRYGIASIFDFSPEDVGGYSDEYIISLLGDEIWCEPLERENKYISVEASVVYIMDYCNSKIIPKINATFIYEVEIDEDDCCDKDCSNRVNEMPCVKTKYSVNEKDVTKEEYEDKLAEIDERFQKYMKTVSEDYFTFMDEMKNWKDLLDW